MNPYGKERTSTVIIVGLLDFSFFGCMHSHLRVHVPLPHSFHALSLPRRRVYELSKQVAQQLAQSTFSDVHHRHQHPFPLFGRFIHRPVRRTAELRGILRILRAFL